MPEGYSGYYRMDYQGLNCMLIYIYIVYTCHGQFISGKSFWTFPKVDPEAFQKLPPIDLSFFLKILQSTTVPNCSQACCTSTCPTVGAIPPMKTLGSCCAPFGAPFLGRKRRIWLLRKISNSWGVAAPHRERHNDQNHATIGLDTTNSMFKLSIII